MLNKIEIRTRLHIAVGALVMFPWSVPVAMSQAAHAGPAVKRVVGMEYPWFARMARLQGTVTLAATILRDGTVGGIQVASGPEPLATPSKETLSKWRFTGCASSSDECVIRVVFSFVLKGSCGDSTRCSSEFQMDLPDQIQITSQVFAKLLYDGRKP